jgi:Na+-driven multidrug efflux pump
MLALSIFLLTFFNMYFIVDYKNDALVAGYGIANTIWSCTILCPNISLGQGFYVFSSQALGAN